MGLLIWNPLLYVIYTVVGGIQSLLRLLSNRINRDSLKPGDHIYSWRKVYFYAHHGIYVGDEKVIHFTKHGQSGGSTTARWNILPSSGSAQTQEPCPTCCCTPPGDEGHGVISSCLNCFLAGGSLYRFEYGVTTAFFLAARTGTCIRRNSDRDDVVIHRANELLNNGFRYYDIFTSNCEVFAFYCKTQCVALNHFQLLRSGQESMIIVLSFLIHTLVTIFAINDYRFAPVFILLFCNFRISVETYEMNHVTVKALSSRPMFMGLWPRIWGYVTRGVFLLLVGMISIITLLLKVDPPAVSDDYVVHQGSMEIAALYCMGLFFLTFADFKRNRLNFSSKSSFVNNPYNRFRLLSLSFQLFFIALRKISFNGKTVASS